MLGESVDNTSTSESIDYERMIVEDPQTFTSQLIAGINELAPLPAGPKTENHSFQKLYQIYCANTGKIQDNMIKQIAAAFATLEAQGKRGIINAQLKDMSHNIKSAMRAVEARQRVANSEDK